MASTPDDPSAAQPILETADERAAALRGVSRSYPSPIGPTVALDDVSLDVAASGLTVVTGTAGSGTSTLLRIVACLDRSDTGGVWVAGADAQALDQRARRELRRTSIGVLQAHPEHNLLPGLDIGANLVWAAKRRTGAVLNAAGVEAQLETVGLSGFVRKRVGHLLRGEQQRLALACALAGTPRLLVADEPTSTLDADDALRLANALRDAADRGFAVLVGTRDENVVAVADAVAQLEAGRRTA
jgi:putative ABC transport system ATP-binding protein/macrolide transport system ATP-binding/permease protein